MKNFALINSDGTIFNIVNMVDADSVTSNPDWSGLHFVEYTDWAEEDKPRMHWTYNFESNSFNKLPVNVPEPLPAEPLVPLTEPATDELAGGN
jgi:hypothetical protein